MQCAKRFDIPVPSSWTENEKAGANWLTGFLKRTTNLSVRLPEATSFIQQRQCVAVFAKLATVMDRCKLHPKAIWNVDETIVAPKGVN